MKRLLLAGTAAYVLGVHAVPLAHVAARQVRNLHDLVREMPVVEAAQFAGQGCDMAFQVAHQIPMRDIICQAKPELAKAADGLGKIPFGGAYLHVNSQPPPMLTDPRSDPHPAPRARVLSAEGFELAPVEPQESPRP